MSWKKADFGINPEHPPLVKALAAIPLLPMGLKVPEPEGLASFKGEAYFDGRDFIFGNGGEAEADRIIFRARMAAATLSLLLGLLVFLAAREMFGDGAALFALALVVFEPNMIAHGAYVTTDMGVLLYIRQHLCLIPLREGAFGQQVDRSWPGQWTRPGVETLRRASPPIRPGTHYY